MGLEQVFGILGIGVNFETAADNFPIVLFIISKIKMIVISLISHIIWNQIEETMMDIMKMFNPQCRGLCCVNHLSGEWQAYIGYCPSRGS